MQPPADSPRSDKSHDPTSPFRIGVDLGGTKIETAVLAASGETLARHRRPTPRDDYAATINAVVGAVHAAVDALPVEYRADAARAPIGVGMPGSISPTTGMVQNANSVWLNGRPFAEDLAVCLGHPVRVANDANCFALSEATDGASAGVRSVLGVILGTGVGGGIVIDGRLVDGPRGIGGEWGHNPLPWPVSGEVPGPACWCGRCGCMEAWVSGPALSGHHRVATGLDMAVADIAAAAFAGDAAASGSIDRHADRLARGLAQVVNLLDPDVIVFGGGLSHLPHLYDRLPTLMAPRIFADDRIVRVVPAQWGDASGVRGAAWLWPWATKK